MKAGFQGRLQAEDIDARRRKLLAPLVYFPLKTDYILIIPEGFISDGATIPRILWTMFRPWGKHSAAAVLHDWLYYGGKFTRKEADKLFYEAMDLSGVAVWKMELIYSAVRMFGRKAWKKHRKREKENTDSASS